MLSKLSASYLYKIGFYRQTGRVLIFGIASGEEKKICYGRERGNRAMFCHPAGRVGVKLLLDLVGNDQVRGMDGLDLGVNPIYSRARM